MKRSGEKIAVIGLGYVGLPVAVAMAKAFPGTVGFDISQRRISSLRDGHDYTGEVSSGDLSDSGIAITSDPADLRDASFFIVTVPTPIDGENRPDLSPIESACEIIGRNMKSGSVVVFESTVYPGVTEDVCGKLLQKFSGLECGREFFLAYSPERINPGDKVHRLENITKIVAGQNEATLQRVVDVYGTIIKAGLHKAPTIKVAEAAKVIENTQRDLNIALMNELAVIFDRMNIRTKDVLAAAGTKWNFLPFTPGLVGGHCIGVDPYYLTTAAQRLGYRPEVILAGRNINDGMGAFIAQKLVKLLVQADRPVNGARVGIMGLTFKENVPDLRNSRVPDMIAELRSFGIDPMIYDPKVDPEDAKREYGLDMSESTDLAKLDGLILAVSHDVFVEEGAKIVDRIDGNGVLIDIKSIFDPDQLDDRVHRWSP